MMIDDEGLDEDAEVETVEDDVADVDEHPGVRPDEDEGENEE